MSSKASARIGSQEPRIRIEPDCAYTDGPDTAELGKGYGMEPFPWQRLILDAWLARTDDDDYAAQTAGLACPRQNGKNAIMELRELYGLVTTGETIVHTAHEVKTARKAFLRLARFFDDERRYPELHEMLVTNGIRRTNGQEGIYLKNGGSIEFSARSRGANRGFTVDLVVFDEAQELTDEQQAAMMYALSAAPSGHRQLIYMGTPPGPNVPGEVFERIRRQAITGSETERFAWHEWSVEEIGDVTDRDRWYATNPSLGLLLTERWIQTELTNSKGADEYFARERLGWWASEMQAAAIPMKTWEKLEVGESPDEGVDAYGVKFSADGAWVSLAVCRRPKEGVPHIELIAHKTTAKGIDWLGDWLVERRKNGAAFVIDGKANQAELAAQLRNGGIPAKAIVLPAYKDVISSATRLMNAVKEKRITHYGQPVLDECVRLSRKRPIGKDGGWGWGCYQDEDSSPLEAVSLAYWGAMTTKRRPGRSVRVL